MSKRTLIALLLALPVFVRSYLDIVFVPWSWLIGLSLLVLAPVSEELIFRGVLQNFLEGRFAAKAINPLWAVPLVSALFAVLHFVMTGRLERLLVFFPSLVLGWHYQKEKSLLLVILIHSFYNINYFL